MDIRLKRTLSILLLLLAFLGVIFLTMPVQFMVVQLGLPDNVRIGHIVGTMQSGRASGVAYQGKIGEFSAKDLRMDLAWVWCPGRGITALCVRLESPLLNGTGTVAYSLFGGEFTASDTRVSVKLQDYPLRLGPLKSKLEAVGDIYLEKLSLDRDDARVLTDLRASGEIRDLYVNKLSLGNHVWRANLEESGRLASDFSGGNDRFSVKGQASLDLGERSYRYAADLKTGESGLQELLKSRAKKFKGDTLTFSGDGKLDF